MSCWTHYCVAICYNLIPRAFCIRGRCLAKMFRASTGWFYIWNGKSLKNCRNCMLENPNASIVVSFSDEGPSCEPFSSQFWQFWQPNLIFPLQNLSIRLEYNLFILMLVLNTTANSKQRFVLKSRTTFVTCLWYFYDFQIRSYHGDW